MILSTQQKVICAAAVALIAISCIFAPYEYRVHNEIARMVNGDRTGTPVTGITYAPIWAPPAQSDGLVGPDWARGVGGVGVAVDDVRFSTGRLLIEWLLILAVGALALVFWPDGSNASSPTHTGRKAFR